MITYETHYVNKRQTVTIYRDGAEIGAIQQSRTGRWLPRRGQGIASELPSMEWQAPTDPKIAIAWVTGEPA